MERVNTRIVVAGLILMATGVYRLRVQGQNSPYFGAHLTITRVLVGGYILILVASIIDLAGGPVSTLTGLIMALAVVTAMFAVIPDLFKRLNLFQQRQAPGGGSHPTYR